MVEVVPDGSDPTRGAQFELLRRTCLPEMALLLHNILHETGQFREAVRVADMVADEVRRHYVLFTTDTMSTVRGAAVTAPRRRGAARRSMSVRRPDVCRWAQLLARVRASSMALLEQGPDPLGYAVEPAPTHAASPAVEP